MSLAAFALDWTMQSTYVVCATIGGAVLVLQTVLLLFGIGDGHAGLELHHDVGGIGSVHHDGDRSDGAFNLLSVRSVASFLTFFGLTGAYATSREWSPGVALLVAFLAGGTVMLIVAWMLRAQQLLESQGNLDPRNALGASARVYLRIPAGNAGFGKVTATVQGRTVEFNAFTRGPELPTGALVKLAHLSTPDTFEVVALEDKV